MATKTEQNHIEAELTLFEQQGKGFRCRGAQEQDLGAVVAKIEQSRRLSTRAAERATTEEDQKKHEALAKQSDELAWLVLEAAACLRDGAGTKRFNGLSAADLGDQPVDGDLGRVRTGRVIAALILVGFGEEATRLDRLSRKNCGADLAHVVAALPRPCESEPYTCPKCGRVGHVSKTALL